MMPLLALVSGIDIARTDVVASDVHNLIVNGGFEDPGLNQLNLTKPSRPGTWSAVIHGRSDAAIAVVNGEGRAGSCCSRYTRFLPRPNMLAGPTT
jgi:hypothetical protein